MTSQQKSEKVIFNLLIGLALKYKDRGVNIAVGTLKLGHFQAFKIFPSQF